MGCLLRLASGLVGIAVLLVGAAVFASQQTPTVASGLSPIVASAEAARSFDDKVAAAARTAGAGAPVEVSFTEQELTSKIQLSASALGDGAVSARDTQVHLRHGEVIATTTITLQGFSVNVGIVAAPTTVDGVSRLVVKDVQTGLIPLPGALRDQLNAQIQDALDPRSLGLPLDLATMTAGDGTLVIRGSARELAR